MDNQWSLLTGLELKSHTGSKALIRKAPKKKPKRACKCHLQTWYFLEQL